MRLFYRGESDCYFISSADAASCRGEIVDDVTGIKYHEAQAARRGVVLPYQSDVAKSTTRSGRGVKMSEQTWGFNFEAVQEAGFDELPPGHYTMEIAETTFKTNKNGEEYLSVVHNILDAEDSDLIGRKHFQYVSLDPERLQYTKKDWKKMGVPEKALTNNGGPSDMIGTVFTCDLVRNDKGYTNMRYIQAKTQVESAQSPEKGKTEAQPTPKRAATSRR